MSKARNHVIYSDDEAKLRRLKEECELYVGRQCEIRDNSLVIFALPQKKQKPKKDAAAAGSEKWSKTERNYGYTRG